MKSVTGYHLIGPDDLQWRPSSSMRRIFGGKAIQTTRRVARKGEAERSQESKSKDSSRRDTSEKDFAKQRVQGQGCRSSQCQFVEKAPEVYAKA